MPRLRDLQCPNGCEARFEALNAPLYVGHDGGYVGHDDSVATYVCSLCGSVAVDLAATEREMRLRGEATPATLVCPACATEMLPPEDDPFAAMLECPMCGQHFSLEEGTPHLHRGGPGEAGGDGDA